MKATSINGACNLRISLIAKSDYSQVQTSDIVYFTLESFLKYQEKHSIKNIYGIIDESDSIFFESCKNLEK